MSEVVVSQSCEACGKPRAGVDSTASKVVCRGCGEALLALGQTIAWDPPKPAITIEHVTTVCRPGELAATCKYLIVGPQGWCCAKTRPGLRASIDRRTDMHAKGDNCEGRS